MIKCECGKEATKFLKGAGNEVEPYCQKCYSEKVKSRGIIAITIMAVIFLIVFIWCLLKN